MTDGATALRYAAQDLIDNSSAPPKGLSPAEYALVKLADLDALVLAVSRLVQEQNPGRVYPPTPPPPRAKRKPRAERPIVILNPSNEK